MPDTASISTKTLLAHVMLICYCQLIRHVLGVQLSSGTAAVNCSSAAAMDALQRFALALNEHPHPLAVLSTNAFLLTMHASASRQCCWPLQSSQMPCLRSIGGMQRTGHGQAWWQESAACM